MVRRIVLLDQREMMAMSAPKHRYAPHRDGHGDRRRRQVESGCRLKRAYARQGVGFKVGVEQLIAWGLQAVSPAARGLQFR